MPGVEDWMNNPLDVIHNLLDHEDSSLNTKSVKDYFTRKLQSKAALALIPSINHTRLHNLKPNSLVKYRCMIQDMFDPEFYLGRYEVTDIKTKRTSFVSGKYKDVADSGSHQEINLESPRNVTMDRQTLYCVPVPGETEWVKKKYTEQNITDTGASTSFPPVRQKRSRDEESLLTTGTSEATEINGAGSTTESGEDIEMEADSLDSKRNRTLPSGGSGSAPVPDLNYPLPGETGPACLVKVYDEVDAFKVNDVVEFIGVLSVDPAMAQFQEKNEDIEEMYPEFETEAERHAHAPPPSLVPRLHAILSRKFVHNNPLLPPVITDEDFVQALNQIQSEIASIRSDLLSILEHALFGDRLAAEYVLCHIVSNVYARADMMPMGKLCMNISGCPNSRDYAKLLSRLLSAIVTQCHILPMTIENMNQSQLAPYKDYSANRLKSGILQLCDNTHLVIDETVLEPGQLNPDGVKNVTALGNLIRWAKVEYDFSYHKQEFPANVNVLIVSEGESLLPKDCQVKLEKRHTPEDLTAHFSQLDEKLTAENLAKFRMYITLTKQLDYTMSDNMQKHIQDDFVEARKESPKSMSVDDFHSLLNLVRILVLTHCQVSPTPELWDRAKSMEQERKQRLGPSRATVL